jgi:hypothetical protein
MPFPAHTETNVRREEHVKIMRNYDDLMRGSQSGKQGKSSMIFLRMYSWGQIIEQLYTRLTL